jgi:methylisocitrate lyase
VHGLDDAIARCQLYREAGADLLFVDAPVSVEELRRVCSEIDGPCFANLVEGGKTPILSARQLEAMGFAAVTWPVSASYAIARAVADVYAALLRDGTTNAVRDRMLDFAAFNSLIGLEQVREAEAACDEFARDLLEQHGAEDAAG